MDRLSLMAEERIVLGKKVKNLRKIGKIPAHVFGKGLETEHVSVDGKTFLKTFEQAGETGLIDLKIGGEKIKPVLVREVAYHPVTGEAIHVDFYQVNLSVKVSVPVPLELIGEEPEKVHLGEAIILQTLNEVEVEALPTDLIEKIEVNIGVLNEIDDMITVGDLNYDRDKLTISEQPEEVVVKLAPAVTAEMEALLEEQAAETVAAAEEAVTEDGAAASADSASVATSAKEAGSGEPMENAEVESGEGKVPSDGGEVASETAEGKNPQ